MQWKQVKDSFMLRIHTAPLRNSFSRFAVPPCLPYSGSFRWHKDRGLHVVPSRPNNERTAVFQLDHHGGTLNTPRSSNVSHAWDSQ